MRPTRLQPFDGARRTGTVTVRARSGRHALRAVVVTGVALVASGCIEIDGVLAVNPDGSAINRTEIRLATKTVRDLDRDAAAAKRKRPAAAADETKSFAEMCASLGDPAERTGGTPPLPAPKTMTAAVSTRGTWTICTVTETIPDPAGYYTQISAQLGMTDERFERTESGDAYRFVSNLRLSRLLAAMQAKPGELDALAELRTLVPARAQLAFAITSARIADTDGRVAAEGKSVRWTYPIRRLLDPRPHAPPLAARATIHFR